MLLPPLQICTKKLIILKSEFDTLATDQAESKLLQLRHTVYESEYRPSKVLLAYQPEQASTCTFISELTTPTDMTTDPQKISHFKDFYSSLHKSEQNTDTQALESFFSQI